MESTKSLKSCKPVWTTWWMTKQNLSEQRWGKRYPLPPRLREMVVNIIMLFQIRVSLSSWKDVDRCGIQPMYGTLSQRWSDREVRWSLSKSESGPIRLRGCNARVMSCSERARYPMGLLVFEIGSTRYSNLLCKHSLAYVDSSLLSSNLENKSGKLFEQWEENSQYVWKIQHKKIVTRCRIHRLHIVILTLCGIKRL